MTEATGMIHDDSGTRLDQVYSLVHMSFALVDEPGKVSVSCILA